jgi:hypothetical protein
VTILEGLHKGPGGGVAVPLQCDADGKLLVSGASGGSGSSGGLTNTELRATPPATTEAVIASDGAALNLASLAQSIARNADGSVSYVEVVSGGSTYRQTLTYTSGAVTGVSAWVKQ